MRYYCCPLRSKTQSRPKVARAKPHRETCHLPFLARTNSIPLLPTFPRRTADAITTISPAPSPLAVPQNPHGLDTWNVGDKTSCESGLVTVHRSGPCLRFSHIACAASSFHSPIAARLLIHLPLLCWHTHTHTYTHIHTHTHTHTHTPRAIEHTPTLSVG